MNGQQTGGGVASSGLDQQLKGWLWSEGKFISHAPSQCIQCCNHKHVRSHRKQKKNKTKQNTKKKKNKKESNSQNSSRRKKTETYFDFGLIQISILSQVWLRIKQPFLHEYKYKVMYGDGIWLFGYTKGGFQTLLKQNDWCHQWKWTLTWWMGGDGWMRW